MLLIYESIFVGVYCLCLYIILGTFFTKFNYYTWFIFGFIKHFLSYWIGIQDYYCVNGNACKQYLYKYADNYNLGFDSIMEGFLFIIVGYIFIPLFKNKYLAVFLAGVFLHLFMEMINVHKIFCKKRCVK